MRPETMAYAKQFNPKARRSHYGINIHTYCPQCKGVMPGRKSGPLLVWEQATRTGIQIRYKCLMCQVYGVAESRSLSNGPFAIRELL